MINTKVMLSNFMFITDPKESEILELPKHARRRMSRNGQIAKLVIDQMLKQNLNIPIMGKDTGVIYASCFGAIDEEEQGTIKYISSNNISPLFLPNILPNMVASNLSIDLNLQGLNYCINTGVTAFLEAIINGIDYIQQGQLDSVIIVGSESCISYNALSFAELYHQNKLSYNTGGGALLLTKDNNMRNKYKINNYKYFFSNDTLAKRSKMLFEKEVNQKINTYGNGYLIGNHPILSSDTYIGCLQSIVNIKQLLRNLDESNMTTGGVFSMLENGSNIYIEFVKQ
ncbi:beta-ketoacyl synthase N-terminal-like domain-containing protein [Paraliobacillus sp. JSM ZJ581]|uniref:beta-ketoacyl synthase N-terminal-like domain-containing protein n=1 Tax=Paraliobacillus sp. JSM ZJ581 TaxID=3342118 RepID=UPI0035A849EA